MSNTKVKIIETLMEATLRGISVFVEGRAKIFAQSV